MMTDKEYNDFFRSRLDDFSSGVGEKLWDNIKAENKKKRSQWFAVAKYILPVICLILSLKTTDKMMMSDKGNVAFFAKNNERNKTDNSTLNQSKKHNEQVANKPISAANKTTNSHLFAAQAKRRKAAPALTFINYKPLDKQSRSDEIKQSDDLADNTNQRDADSITNSIKTAKKKESKTPHKQADSTADITVNEHSNYDRLFLYVFASPDIPFANITSANSIYQQLRNEQAKQRFSYSAGVRLSVNINQHWSGNTGVQYSQINEQIKMPNNTSNNHYKSLDVPLIIGYRVYKNKLDINVNAGIILNISSSYSGYISSVDNEPVNVHLANVYKNNTSLSYYGGVQFLFKPDNKITFFAEPYFKYQPGNIVNAFQSFEEHVQKAGLLLGARYRFGK